MPDDLTKEAVKMLLHGATLLKEPCPYCKGVRVMKDGFALCVNCGKKPEKKSIDKPENTSALDILEKKLKKLSQQLDSESDPSKQQQLIQSIDSLAQTISKIKS